MLDEDEAMNITQGLWHCDLSFTVKKLKYTPVPGDHIQSSLRYECHTLLRMHRAYLESFF